MVEIGTNLFFDNPRISSGCFLLWIYSNNKPSNLFHIILQEYINCVCVRVYVFGSESVVGLVCELRCNSVNVTFLCKISYMLLTLRATRGEISP